MTLPPMCEEKTFDEISSELVGIYQTYDPSYIPNESDTVMPALEAFAYRELLLRTHFNAQIAASFWQTATGENLDFIAAFFHIERLKGSKPTSTVKFTLNTTLSEDYIFKAGLELLNEDGSISVLLSDATVLSGATEVIGIAELQLYTASSDTKVISTTEPKAYLSSVTQTSGYRNGSDSETDVELRNRIALAFEDQTTAGSISSYKAHAIRADERIDDVKVMSPTPGHVNIYLHSLEVPDETMIGRVKEALNAERTRPLTDFVSVFAANRIIFSINATLTLDALADSATTLSAAKERLMERLSALKIGQTLTLSSIVAALSVDGVVDVTVISPLLNVTVENTEVAICELVEVSIA